MIQAYLDMSVECKTSSTLNQTTNFSTREILRVSGQFLQIDIIVHYTVGAHFHGMDIKDLEPARFIWERNLHVDFETTGTEEGLVDHIETISHTDDKDVVELINTVHLEKISQASSKYLKVDYL